MAMFDLYSIRKQIASGHVPDVYQYEDISNQFRVQITHIWNDTISNSSKSDEHYHSIVSILRKEYGVYRLVNKNPYPNDDRYSEKELGDFLLQESNVDRVIDVIELSLRYIDIFVRKQDYGGHYNASTIADTAISEFNERAKYHGLGYQFIDGFMIRVDSQLVHKEVVIPALTILSDPIFKSAQFEFLAAHEHYRQGRKSEVLVDCLKSFESTMKVICDKRGWSYDSTKGATELVRACLENNLIPAYWQTHFTGLRSILTSGIPTPRNKQAGHGAGSNPVQLPPDELLSYVLHMTASTILFLANAERNLP